MFPRSLPSPLALDALFADDGRGVRWGLKNIGYEVDPAVTCLAFGCTKSLDVAEVRLPTAAILESTLCWCP